MENFCQSCAMPLTEPQHKGTNQDGTPNEDYCIYCYKDGKFVQDVDMEGMIDHCLQYLDEYNGAAGVKLTSDEARAQMNQFFPMLKRWKNN